MRSITTRLMLAFLAVRVISTLSIVLFTRWRSSEEFRTFLVDQNRPSIVTSFSNYYLQHGSWGGISDANLIYQQPPPRPPMDAAPFSLVDETGQVVMAGQGYEVGQNISPADLAGGVPILVNNNSIGTLLINPTAFRIRPPHSTFLAPVNLQT